MDLILKYLLAVKIFQANLQIFNSETRFELYQPFPTRPCVHRCSRQIHITLGQNPVITFITHPVPELPGYLFDEDEEDIEAGQIFEILNPEQAYPRRNTRPRAAASRSRDRD